MGGIAVATEVSDSGDASTFDLSVPAPIDEPFSPQPASLALSPGGAGPFVTSPPQLAPKAARTKTRDPSFIAQGYEESAGGARRGSDGVAELGSSQRSGTLENRDAPDNSHAVIEGRAALAAATATARPQARGRP